MFKIPETANDLEELGFVIKDPSEFGEEETSYAKGYWMNLGLDGFYSTEYGWSEQIAHIVSDAMKESESSSVFEFGCNAGRNLKSIGKLNPKALTFGVDINWRAIKYGREKLGLDLMIGDEEIVDQMDMKFDIVFTVSALDHVVNIEKACRALSKVALKHILCFELRLPVEGKLIEFYDPVTSKVQKATSATYSWHLEKYIRGSVLIEQFPLPTKTGPYYHAYTFNLHPR